MISFEYEEKRVFSDGSWTLTQIIQRGDCKTIDLPPTFPRNSRILLEFIGMNRSILQARFPLILYHQFKFQVDYSRIHFIFIAFHKYFHLKAKRANATQFAFEWCLFGDDLNRSAVWLRQDVFKWGQCLLFGMLFACHFYYLRRIEINRMPLFFCQRFCDFISKENTINFMPFFCISLVLWILSFQLFHCVLLFNLFAASLSTSFI